MIIMMIRNIFGKPPRFDAALIPSIPAKLISSHVISAIEMPHTILSHAGDSCSSCVMPLMHNPAMAFVLESDAVTNDINTMNR